MYVLKTVLLENIFIRERESRDSLIVIYTGHYYDTILGYNYDTILLSI